GEQPRMRHRGRIRRGHGELGDGGWLADDVRPDGHGEWPRLPCSATAVAVPPPCDGSPTGQTRGSSAITLTTPPPPVAVAGAGSTGVSAASTRPATSAGGPSASTTT